MFIIYCIRHRESGKCYVGQTVQKLQKRWRAHCSKNTCVHLYAAICEYSPSAFAVEMLEVCPEDDLDVRECHWIAALDCIYPNGYNAYTGGSKGRVSPETRAKISQTHKGKKFSAESRAKMAASQRGKKQSPETRAKISQALKGKKKTPEHVAKVAAANKGRKPSPETLAKLKKINTGRKHTPEARAKMSASKKGRKGRSPSAETRAKLSAANKGKRLSPETLEKLSAAQKRAWQRRKRRKKCLAR